MRFYFKLIFCIFFCLQLSTNVVARTNLDSLFKQWRNTSQPDTLRLQAMQRICLYGYLYSKPDTAFILGNEMYAFALKKNLPKYQIFALQLLGSASSIQADNERAIEYFTRSLKLAEETNDTKNIINSINNIGVIYDQQGNNKKAMEYYMRSLVLSEKLGNKSAIITALGNLGNVYRNLGQLDKAIEAQNRSLKLAEENQNKRGRANALHSLAVIYSVKKEYQKALDYDNQVVEYYEAKNDISTIVEVLTIQGECYDGLNQNNKAIKCLKKALGLSLEGGFATGIREAYHNLYFVYKEEGNIKEALNMYEQYIIMRDSIKSQQGQQKVMEKEMQYNYQKQKALDQKEQEKQREVSAAIEQKQKIITYAITLGLVLVLIFSLFVVNRLRITRKQKNIIETQKDIVEEKQKEILASIHYAKRIQDSLLPSENYIYKSLKNLNKKS